MTLLRDIQAAAIDDSASLAALLRRCLVLANRLKYPPLADWANKELEGYSADEELPSYRLANGQAKGDFLGVMHVQRNGTLIPPGSLAAEHRKFATELNFRGGVAEYESIVDSARTGGMAVPWPGDLVLHYQSKLLPGWGMTAAYQTVPPGAIPGLLDAVRTRVLKLALELEKEDPEAGDADTDLARDTVERVVQATIFGDNNTVAIMSPGAIVGNKISAGDFQSLATHLASLGLPANEIASLERAVIEDKETGAVGPGPRVESWFGALAQKAASGSVNVGMSVVGNAVWQAIVTFMG